MTEQGALRLALPPPRSGGGVEHAERGGQGEERQPAAQRVDLCAEELVRTTSEGP